MDSTMKARKKKRRNPREWMKMQRLEKMGEAESKKQSKMKTKEEW